MAGTFTDEDLLQFIQRRRLQDMLAGGQETIPRPPSPPMLGGAVGGGRNALAQIAQIFRQPQAAPTAAPPTAATPPSTLEPSPSTVAPRPKLADAIQPPVVGPVPPTLDKLQELPPAQPKVSLDNLPPSGTSQVLNELQQLPPEPLHAPINTLPPVGAPEPHPPKPIQLPPEMEAYKAKLAEPLPTKEHPSTARRIGGILGGIGAGYLTGSIPYGRQIGSEIEHPKYYEAMRKRQQELSQLGPVADIAAEQYKLKLAAEDKESLAALRTQQAATSAAEQRVHEKEASKFVPTTLSEFIAEKKAGVRPFAKEPVMFSSKDGKHQAFGNFDPNDGQFYDDNNIRLADSIRRGVETGAIQLHKLGTKEEQNKQTTIQERVQTMKAMYRASHGGQEPTGKDLIAILDKAEEEEAGAKRDPALEAVRESQARIVSEQNKDSTAKFLVNNPDMYNAKGFVDPKIKKDVAVKFQELTGYPPPKELKQRDQTAESIGYRSHDSVQEIFRILQSDPRLMSFIGPILGRIGNLEMKAGDIPQMPADLKPLYAELKGQWERLAIREAMNLGQGSRFGAYLMNAVKGSVPNMSWTPEMFLGGLKAIQDDALDSIHAANRAKYTDKYVDKFEAANPVDRKFIIHPDANGHMQIATYRINVKGKDYVWNDKRDAYVSVK